MDVVGVHPVAALVNFKVGTDFTCQTADYDEAAGIGYKTDTCTYSGGNVPASSARCPSVSYRQLAGGTRQVDEITVNSHA